jgi:hypothetical protein
MGFLYQNIEPVISHLFASGGDPLLCALSATIRDEQGRPLPRRSGRHGPVGDAGAGLVQPLQARLAEQGTVCQFRLDTANQPRYSQPL